MQSMKIRISSKMLVDLY